MACRESQHCQKLIAYSINHTSDFFCMLQIVDESSYRSDTDTKQNLCSTYSVRNRHKTVMKTKPMNIRDIHINLDNMAVPLEHHY